ncbi:MAG: hypothetical protein PHE24_01745 [Patescibacteria group bacterium]|nr:hypothetical protein [Patescibacteria group bacterium]
MIDWNEAEKAISDEIEFLKNNISQSPFEQNDPIKCEYCLLRKIAIFIVSGKMKLKKISYLNNSIWQAKNNLNTDNLKKHGGNWHNDLISTIEKYFLTNGIKVEKEPALYYGRADLGTDKNVFIEVGTTNLYKLYLNLSFLKNCKIMLVPSDDYLLEFNL